MQNLMKWSLPKINIDAYYSSDTYYAKIIPSTIYQGLLLLLCSLWTVRFSVVPIPTHLQGNTHIYIAYQVV